MALLNYIPEGMSFKDHYWKLYPNHRKKTGNKIVWTTPCPRDFGTLKDIA